MSEKATPQREWAEHLAKQDALHDKAVELAQAVDDWSKSLGKLRVAKGERIQKLARELLKLAGKE